MLALVALGLGLASVVSAAIHPPLPIPHAVLAHDHTPVHASTGATIPPYNTTYYFDQLIDHNDTSLGTFQQRYWMTWEFYEQGGPIVLMTPGEANAAPYTGYLTNSTINGLIAQAHSGATIVLEHRFYGLSNPYPDLSVSSLAYHTIPQAIEDLDYFARNVVLPMPGGDGVGPEEAPWVLVGGSYSGALTSWTMVAKPDTFWIGYASSAVVESIVDFWAYFEPIRQNMPSNCSADVEAVVSFFDATLSGDNQTAIDELKTLYGMEGLEHADDVAGALRNNLWDWQSLSPDSGPGAQFFNFCDALEVDNKTGAIANETGFGQDHAVQAWGDYFRETYYEILCGDQDAETCLGTYNASSEYYTSTEVDNSGRSWTWITCTTVGFFQDGAPQGYPTLVSRLVQPSIDDLRQCALMFPSAFSSSSPASPDVDLTNVLYEGWNVSVPRLFFANGERDPWRDATVSGDNTTQGPTGQGSEEMPIRVGDGYHCSDLIVRNAVVDGTVEGVQQAALGYIATWLGEWNATTTTTTTTANETETGNRKREEGKVEKRRRPVTSWNKDV